MTVIHIAAFVSLIQACGPSESRTPICPPPAPSSVTTVTKTVIQYVDREDRFRDHVNGKSLTPEGYCSWSRWHHPGHEEDLAWCKAQAAHYDCAGGSWREAWPNHPAYTAGAHYTAEDCCSIDKESVEGCVYIKERARVCDDLTGQTHRIQCLKVPCGLTAVMTVCL